MKVLVGAFRRLWEDTKEIVYRLACIMEIMVSAQRMGEYLDSKVLLLTHFPKGCPHYEEIMSKLLASGNSYKYRSAPDIRMYNRAMKWCDYYTLAQ